MGCLLTLGNPAASGQVFTLTDGSGGADGSHGGLAAASGPAAQRPDRRLSMLHFTRRHSNSIEKARDLLGYQPRIGLDEGMKNVEAWARQEGII
jgi:nucleoside-diphosphate-sugar epimerase